MLQNIINWVMGNAFLIIIIGGGLFNVAVRMAQKAKEQRAKRAALQAMARQKQETLRTGHSVTDSKPTLAQQPQKDPRQERIEALRKERMEQLRALREKRSNPQTSATTSAPTSPTSISQNHPNLPPFPVQNAPLQKRTQATVQSRQSPTPNSGQSRRPNVVATSAQPPSSQMPNQRRRPQPDQTGEQSDQQRRVKRETNQRHAGHVESLREAANPSLHNSIHDKSKLLPEQSARSMLRSRSAIRQAILLREILDTPVALRNQDIASGSIFE